jgi:hypothetical protein
MALTHCHVIVIGGWHRRVDCCLVIAALWMQSFSL